MTTVDEAREALLDIPATQAAFRGAFFAQAVDALIAAVRAEYLDPQDHWRLVRVGTEFLSQFGTRTEDGARLTAEWRDPDAAGVYEPAFTRHDDDNPMRDSAQELAALRKAAQFACRYWFDEVRYDDDKDMRKAMIALRAALAATPAEEER